MKIYASLVTLTLLAGCSSPTGEGTGPATAEVAAGEPATTQVSTPAASTAASASGEVKGVDAAAKTVTIAHGPIAALNWPAMTMKFNAPSADLSTIKDGDQVDFEFTSAGMDGTITKMAKVESRTAPPVDQADRP